jgi:hypothetical protein
MKQLYLHVFYLTIIAFLSYNYWSSVQAFKAFEHLDRQLNMDYQLMDNTASSIFKDINKNAQAYQNSDNRRNNEQSEMSVNTALKLHNDIAAIKTELVNNHPLTDAKINEIKEKTRQFSNNLIDSINDKNDKTDVLKFCSLPKLIADNAYWASIKTLPKNGVIAELSSIQNMMKIDEITLLNYYFSKTSSTEVCGWTVYRAAIAPKKAALIEGETFEADIYISSYSNNLGNNTIIKVNGEPLEIKDGVAHFKSKNQTIGTKTIKAEALIRNPLTGQTTTSVGSFEYQVLPKCSRDCQ